MKDFLLEIHTEELPPKLLTQFSKNLADNFAKEMQNKNLDFESISEFSTPRRLAFLVKNLEEKQGDIEIDKKGPIVNANENAIMGFAKSNQVEVQDLVVKSTDKGEYYYFQNRQIGKKTSDLLAEMSENAIKNMAITRPMRWGGNDFSFIRPVHSIILLFGSEVIDANLFGLASSNTTTGLRFKENSITIDNATNYQKIMLEKGEIEVDFDTRKNIIWQQVQAVGTQHNLEVIANPNLLNEVCSLVELPNAFLGRFDERFLDLPEEVIVLSMAEHQKYFAVRKEGRLENYFIAVANNHSTDIDVVVKGNEKVVRPRLEDAVFFWGTDKETTLESKLEKLKSVVFMQDLGTMFEKVGRVRDISGFIAKNIDADIKLSSRAGLLTKADLVSEMVGEFASLQGIMGGYYAEFDNENSEVAIAIKEHYLPKFAGDDLPSSKIAISTAVADKIDTICGIFSIDQAPTGSKDPYALRRLALGVMRIFIEKEVDLNLKELILYSLGKFNNSSEKIAGDIFNFMLERLKSYYQDKGVKTTSIIAASDIHPELVFDLHKRIIAIDNFAKTKDGDELIAINKRIKGILEGAKYSINENFAFNEEKSLEQYLNNVKSSDYATFMQELLQLKQPLDEFFNNLVVNDENQDIRDARFTLLKKVADKFNTLGRF